MSTHTEAADHVRKACEHIRQATRVWADQVVHPEVRGHLRDAARSVLHAGLATIDAADRRDRERRQPAPAADSAAPTA
jgi:hypothetical protein